MSYGVNLIKENLPEAGRSQTDGGGGQSSDREISERPGAGRTAGDANISRRSAG